MKKTRFSKFAQHQADLEMFGDYDKYRSVDEWLEDKRLSDNDIKTIWFVLAALTEGDNPINYKNVSDNFFIMKD